MKFLRIPKREVPLHLMLLPGVLLLIVFSYIPMSGIVIAFQKYNPARGSFLNQTFCGMDNFNYIFSMPNISSVFFNTLLIAVGKIVVGTVVAIGVALMLNECRNMKFKRSIQTAIYFPYFMSWIILSGVVIDILSPNEGIVNQIIKMFGGEPVFFLGDNRWFPWTMIATDTWRNFGFNTIVYLATITSIDPTLYEAAAIDGGNRWKQTLHITLPGMKMIIVLLMVLNLGNVLNAGFDQIFNMYSPQVYASGDIIDTLVYRMGLVQAKFGPSTAVGLLKSVISCGLISISYYVSYKFFNYNLF